LNIGHIGQMIGRLGVMLRGGSIATILPAFRALFNGAMGTDITAYTPDIGGGAFSYTGDNTGTLKLDGSGNIITTTITSLPAAAFYTLPANPSRITLTYVGTIFQFGFWNPSANINVGTDIPRIRMSTTSLEIRTVTGTTQTLRATTGHSLSNGQTFDVTMDGTSGVIEIIGGASTCQWTHPSPVATANIIPVGYVTGQGLGGIESA